MQALQGTCVGTADDVLHVDGSVGDCKLPVLFEICAAFSQAFGSVPKSFSFSQ
jgi:hypothetical protein